MDKRAFSSTGKAILAGGYLVLFPEYRAYVVALSARMHALTQIGEPDGGTGSVTITVKSPQFSNGCWSYSIEAEDIAQQSANLAPAEKNGRSNPFVVSTIVTVLSYCLGKHIFTPDTPSKEVVIDIFSDAEYHSQDDCVAKTSTNSSQKFLYHTQEISQVNKTGLGSSAGLVTSLTAALLSAFIKDFSLTEGGSAWKEKVHNLAQVAHCKAQGKIGSGFDVASATFGSIIYQRFEPKLVTDVLEARDAELTDKLVHLVDKEDWKMTHILCALPPGIKLLMGDVKGGSETPRMVSKVLEWKKNHPERCDAIWGTLNANNMKLIDSLKRLNEIHDSNACEYEKIMEVLKTKNSSQLVETAAGDSSSPLKDIASSIRSIRHCLQSMTSETGAAIEPESQTKLLDAVGELDGVLGGVVPGAGGYDAICVLISSSKIDDVVSASSANPTFKSVRWMDVSEMRDGLIEETYSDFAGLV